jgi:hypothetical protein
MARRLVDGEPDSGPTRRSALVTVLVLVIGVAACSTPSSTSAGPHPVPEPGAHPGQVVSPVDRTPTLGPIGSHPTTRHGVTLDIISGLVSGTPIYDGDFADPFALRTTDSTIAYASTTQSVANPGGAHIPAIVISRDQGFTGTYAGDVLPELPSWTVTGFQWAPAVWARPQGGYVLYYSTPATHPLDCFVHPSAAGCVRSVRGPTSAMCISRATAADPLGPFTDDSPSAFVCPVSQGGAIDPSVFVAADGTPWLLWKSDGDCCNQATTIYSQQLAPDGLSTVGPPHRLLGASQPWEGNLVEGPSMIDVDGVHWLFYSANLWGSADYGIGIARCASVTGPCTKPLDHAWFSTADNGPEADPGPGGQEFWQAGQLVWMVHHGLAPGQVGNDAQRRLYVDLLSFPTGGIPRIAPGPPAAALALALLYFEDPHLPKDPQAAYLALLRATPQLFDAVSDASARSAAWFACTELGRHAGTRSVLTGLEQRGLSPVQAYVVVVFATQYLCTDHWRQALSDFQAALGQGS